MGHQAQPFAFDASAKQDAGVWLAQLKANTEKEPLAKLFSMFKRETTVRSNAIASHLAHLESLPPPSIVCHLPQKCQH